jgi:hypothetical protein
LLRPPAIQCKRSANAAALWLFTIFEDLPADYRLKTAGAVEGSGGLRSAISRIFRGRVGRI